MAPDSLIHGRFRRIATAGRGAFGRVLHVHDVQANQSRALKIVPRGIHETMLLDEFEQLARLRHASLPRVFEVGRTREPIDDIAAGAAFFVAEWIAGPRSDACEWRSDAAAVWSLLADLAGALATIHAAGLVHADVAPQNVLVTSERAVLVDLGLSGGRDARGTPAYMAPEALAGHVEPRSDLYGLGATTIRLVTGRPPFEGATLGELVQRIVSGRPPTLATLPGPLADLVGRLVARDPDARPPSALALLDELDQLAPAIAPASTRRARPKVGSPPAPATWPGARAFVDELAAVFDARTHAVVAVVGVAASGARHLVDAAIRACQLSDVARGRPTAPAIAGSLDEVAARLAVTASTSSRGYIERVARAARAAGSRVVIELGDDARGDELFAALARAPGDHPTIVIADTAPSRVAAVHRVPLLDIAGVAALGETMLGAAPPRPWATALHTTSGGLPLTVVELLRSIANEREPFAVDWSARASAGLVEVRAKALRTVSPGAQRIAIAIAAWGGRASIDRVLATARANKPAGAGTGLGELHELVRVGIARRTGDYVAIDRATCEAVEQVAGSGAVGEAAAATLDAIAGRAKRAPRKPNARAGVPAEILDDDTQKTEVVDATELDVIDQHRSLRGELSALAPLLDRAPLDADRARLACDVADQLLVRGRPDRALELARRALAIAPDRAGLVGARAASATGAYRDAALLARTAADAGADAVEAELVTARAAQRAGELDDAEGMLARLHAAHPAHADVAGTYARLLVTRSRYADARRIAVAVSPLAGLAAEAAGLAAFYLGELDDADVAFAALEVGAAAGSGGNADHASVGRALSLRGMVAQQRGQLALASDRYRDAARRLGDVGELHAAAVAELNLGTVLSERGRSSEALPRLAAAARVFAELGATTELCAAELNRGNALVALGQLDEARTAADSALARAENTPHLRAFALMIAGDARRRLGDDAGALRHYRDALAIGNERGDAHSQISAHCALAELGFVATTGGLVEIGKRLPTEAVIDVDALCASTDDRDRWTLARGRLALRADADSQAQTALARACADVAARAAAGDRLERAFRGHSIAAQLAQRARDPVLARAEAESARGAHATMTAAAAPAFRAALDADPDLVALPGTASSRALQRTEPVGPPLRRLLTLSRRLNSEASVERILDEVIDTAIELTSAERGFLLLRQADGALAPVVSRNFSVGDLSTPLGVEPSVSRSIAERAAQSGEPVMTVDAGVDERFGGAASVAALRLRSVLAVPLRQRGVITGCIYVDHRLRGGAFDDDAASVLAELADIAAIAIENARLAADLRRTTREVDQLNARLSAELAERDAELVRVKADLPDRDRLRHRYERIVGRSAPTVRMLELVDRAAATALPVVIVGESGTGKELVARALHDHGPRGAAPFVAINCSAVPEPLLESELFGHVRGSFTGADRDRRGLFEVADGGTLFLDEIADTSPAMQAKLLRVLQDGMVRRVGDSKTRKVDVRVIAASQRSLAELVVAGAFREDLRFRIEVITIAVPPLRDRDGDIPLLVENLLVLLCPNRTAPRLTRAAMRALGGHRWPGNVRELENALARAVAMGGDVIDVDDLPEAIANAAGRPEPAKPVLGEDLRLKPALTSTEQAYIAAAMGRAKGNQTVAAKLLGLSRFGLQKKLRRLAGEDADDSDD